MKLKNHWLYFIMFVLILVVNGIFYWGCQDNYFFSDDFHWLGRAVLAQDSLGEIFRIEGRDFNPVFLVLLWILIKIFGLSPLMLRITSLLVFSGVIWMFFYILARYFKVHFLIAFLTALLSGFSVFVSEVVLNLSALVYSLSLLFFLVALKFYFDPMQTPAPKQKESHEEHEEREKHREKKWLYLLFLCLAFFTKETIILAVIPLFFYEKEKRSRIFLIGSTGILLLLRVVLQMGAAASSYTTFLTTDHIFYKLYFILTRAMSLSPYSMPLWAGVLVIVVLFLISIYFIIKKERGFLFFLLLLVIFSLFFSLLPRLTSRYFFYPTFGFWGIAALLTHYFYEKKKTLKYALIPLVLVSMFFNYSLIKREIEDYKILGDFSKQFIQQQADLIKNQLSTGSSLPGVILYKRGNRPLAAVYQKIINRKNLPKLLPFRQKSIDGVIEPRHLIPIIFYPEKIARWSLIEETPYYFKGEIKD